MHLARELVSRPPATRDDNDRTPRLDARLDVAPGHVAAVHEDRRGRGTAGERLGYATEPRHFVTPVGAGNEHEMRVVRLERVGVFPRGQPSRDDDGPLRRNANEGEHRLRRRTCLADELHDSGVRPAVHDGRPESLGKRNDLGEERIQPLVVGQIARSAYEDERRPPAIEAQRRKRTVKLPLLLHPDRPGVFARREGTNRVDINRRLGQASTD